MIFTHGKDQWVKSNLSKISWESSINFSLRRIAENCLYFAAMESQLSSRTKGSCFCSQIAPLILVWRNGQPSNRITMNKTLLHDCSQWSIKRILSCLCSCLSFRAQGSREVSVIDGTVPYYLMAHPLVHLIVVHTRSLWARWRSHSISCSSSPNRKWLLQSDHSNQKRRSKPPTKAFINFRWIALESSVRKWALSTNFSDKTDW